MSCPVTKTSVFKQRRERLHAALETPALLAAGELRSRNFPANAYPFRASSHFLYFLGQSIPGAALLFADGRSILFSHAPDPMDALWHGPRPSLAEVCEQLALDEVRPLGEVSEVLASLGGPVATLPTEDAASGTWLTGQLGRTITPHSGDALEGPDAALADAIIDLRLRHDDAAIAQLRHAAKISAEAHIAGMQATRPGGSEYATMAAMIGVLRHAGLDDAYGPIVTVHGEVLHSHEHTNPTAAGDLLLADVGGETPEGWAADITRVWPVSGSYSATQRAIYDVVLDAELACIEAARPGVRYREVHECAKRSMVSGLRDIGIFRGDVDGLLERGAAALFFPHGVGHLLGLDVHDMEDLGDRAGYAPGRDRDPRFGDAYLRLDRDLEPGMAVTIEPGFYQVPGILGDARYTSPLGSDLDRDTLAKFSDVRGIRIEDDVLITEDGNEVLTSGVPKHADEIEAVMGS
jgi:Xaa-Pro aminopeptidase